MSGKELVEKIVPNMTQADALGAFFASCNQPDTLNTHADGVLSQLAELYYKLSDPVTPDQAEALRALALREIPFDEVLVWLSKMPMSRQDYLHWKDLPKGIFPENDVEASRNDAKLQQSAEGEYGAHPEEPGVCPNCQQPLTWIWFSSPGWTWEKLCGRAGWLAICDHCRLQVKFDLVVMN